MPVIWVFCITGIFLMIKIIYVIYMEKIIDKIKKVLFKVLPKDRQLEGDAYQRGRQSLAIEIADIIDPISNDVQPNMNVENGDVLFQEKMIAQPASVFGYMCYRLGFRHDGTTITLGDIQWDDDEHRDTEYEVTIRKIGKVNPEKAVEEKAHPRRKQRHNGMFDVDNDGLMHVEFKDFNV